MWPGYPCVVVAADDSNWLVDAWDKIWALDTLTLTKMGKSSRSSHVGLKASSETTFKSAFKLIADCQRKLSFAKVYRSCRNAEVTYPRDHTWTHHSTHTWTHQLPIHVNSHSILNYSTCTLPTSWFTSCKLQDTQCPGIPVYVCNSKSKHYEPSSQYH